MIVSLFDIFKLGIGPSSSHTVGPMVAARRFLDLLHENAEFDSVAALRIRLHGSLALTGRGHATDVAVLLGLAGKNPQTVDPDEVEDIFARARHGGRLALDGARDIPFDYHADLEFCPETLPLHVNGLLFAALDAEGQTLRQEIYYSVGGGFVMSAAELEGPAPRAMEAAADAAQYPYPFRSAAELLEMSRKHGGRIADVVMENELVLRSRAEVVRGLDAIRDAMRACIDRGMSRDGVLPGGLNVRRRARGLYEKLKEQSVRNSHSPQETLQWVSMFAIAVNEENAAGGRVVTAPTNGAAGVVPAVLRYYEDICDAPTRDGARVFLLTAAAIGMIIKRNASISGAEVGCQGEVGSACAMAAAGLAAALGGDDAQVENAAEIGLEHNLGLTCDPVAGLVQLPCIERNAMGAVKAVNAAHLALAGDGAHMVSLDAAVEAMRRTGQDMHPRYKETSQGGLATVVRIPVNQPEC